VPLQLAVSGMIGGSVASLLCFAVLFWGSRGQVRWVASANLPSKAQRTNRIIRTVCMAFFALFLGQFLLPMGPLRLAVGIFAYSAPFLALAFGIWYYLFRPLLTGRPNR
jgi:CBS domain containing-hemolysin-like protein